MAKTVRLLTLVLLTASTPITAQESVEAYLRRAAQAPVDYLVSKIDTHPIVIVGEAHWIRHDVQLMSQLWPALRARGADMAIEVLPAAEQAHIDKLLQSPVWDEKGANQIMRAAAWPYIEYRDLLRAAWTANQSTGKPVRLLALGPPADWRQSLIPKGITYDGFMANLVAQRVRAGGRVVVYCGMHHAFTRYYQAELTNSGTATAYMDRMGNLLTHEFGARVFLVALHKPWWCGAAAKPSYCLPFGGLVDCAAARVARPLGFDVVGSPLADARFDATDYYAYGHPNLRFSDYTDGYVWFGPLESYALVSLIPLGEYAPDAAALAAVAHENPITDEKDVSVARLEEIWRQEAAANRDPLAKRGWSDLKDWRSRCPK